MAVGYGESIYTKEVPGIGSLNLSSIIRQYHRGRGALTKYYRRICSKHVPSSLVFDVEKHLSRRSIFRIL